MLKKLLKYSFFSVFLLLISCSPRLSPPQLYLYEDLSLEEIIAEVSRDINTLRAVVDVDIGTHSQFVSSLSASVIMKRPGLIHMRVYKLGMLVDEILIREDMIRVLSEDHTDTLEHIGTELYDAVFWWDNLKEASLHSEGAYYVIGTVGKEIRLDRASLLPASQIIRRDGRLGRILYRKPAREGDYWYPSKIEIYIRGHIFRVHVKKLSVNPEPGERDFIFSGDRGTTH
jgi:hypothetical protein